MQSLWLCVGTANRAAAETMSSLQIALLGDATDSALEGEMTIAMRSTQRVPIPLVVLALLVAADGFTTHIGLSLGGVEMNPLFAALFASSLLFAWSLYTAAWGAVLVYLWWAQTRCGRRWWRFWIGFGIIGKGGIVIWNTAQLARLLA